MEVRQTEVNTVRFIFGGMDSAQQQSQAAKQMLSRWLQVTRSSWCQVSKNHTIRIIICRRLVVQLLMIMIFDTIIVWPYPFESHCILSLMSSAANHKKKLRPLETTLTAPLQWQSVRNSGLGRGLRRIRKANHSNETNWWLTFMESLCIRRPLATIETLSWHLTRCYLSRMKHNRQSDLSSWSQRIFRASNAPLIIPRRTLFRISSEFAVSTDAFGMIIIFRLGENLHNYWFWFSVLSGRSELVNSIWNERAGVVARRYRCAMATAKGGSM